MPLNPVQQIGTQMFMKPQKMPDPMQATGISAFQQANSMNFCIEGRQKALMQARIQAIKTETDEDPSRFQALISQNHTVRSMNNEGYSRQF